MNSELIKRNYLVTVYEILKDETSTENFHYTAEELCDIIEQRYSIRPNVKTIYSVINDLISFGVDVKCDKGKLTPGYYLDERCISIGHLRMMADGISSLDIPKSEIVAMYNELERVTGFSKKEFEPVHYGEKELDWMWDEESISEKFSANLKNLSEAIKLNRKVDVFLIFGIQTSIFEQLPQKVLDYLHESSCFNSYELSPRKLFRNSENECYLLFTINLLGKTYAGAEKVSAFEEVAILDKKCRKIDIDALTNKVDFNTFVDVSTYKAGRQIQEGEYEKYSDSSGAWILEGSIKNHFVSSYTYTSSGKNIVHFSYYAKDQEELLQLFMCVSSCLRLLPMESRDYKTLYTLAIEYHNQLVSAYGDGIVKLKNLFEEAENKRTQQELAQLKKEDEEFDEWFKETYKKKN